MAVSRIELYANTNRQRPGFFDNVIPCGHEPEERPSSPLSRSGSGTVMSAAALDPSDPSYRNLFYQDPGRAQPSEKSC
ncbi:hypothetical protein E3U43_020998, partial [Larimichthys crocea]